MFILKRSAACLLIFISTLSLVSCVSTRKTAYFVEQPDGALPVTSALPETVIQKNDIMGIYISSLSPTASTVFNAPNNSYGSAVSITTGTVLPQSGYLVDAQGNIQFPIIGAIKVAGMTGNQLRQTIVRELLDRKLLLDPIVNVRFLNFKVTVLGEVSHPTVINVPSEKITLLEALGLAGDLTIYGKRENIMVIRETDGQKTIKRLDLNSSELFTSPYYYLNSGDIIYAEPNKAKVASAGRSSALLPIIFSGLSFAAIVVDRLTR